MRALSRSEEVGVHAQQALATIKACFACFPGCLLSCAPSALFIPSWQKRRQCTPTPQGARFYANAQSGCVLVGGQRTCGSGVSCCCDAARLALFRKKKVTGGPPCDQREISDPQVAVLFESTAPVCSSFIGQHELSRRERIWRGHTTYLDAFERNDGAHLPSVPADVCKQASLQSCTP